MKILYAGNTNILYGAEAFIAKHLKKAGHEVFELVYPTFAKDYSLINGILEEQIIEIKPDMVLCGKVPGLKFKDIIRLKETYNVPFVQWIFDKMRDINEIDPKGKIRSRESWWVPQAKAFDKVFNAEDNQHDYYNSIGINHSILREGADIDIFKPVTVKQQTQSNHGADVEFHGAIYNDFRKNIIETLYTMPDVDFKHHKNIRIDELNAVLNCSKICISTNYSDFTSSGWSARVVEAMAAGILVLSPNIPPMEKEGFIDKENIVFYKAREVKDLVEKVKYYLKNEEERNKIAKAGIEMIREKHNWDVRIEKLFRILKEEGIING